MPLVKDVTGVVLAGGKSARYGKNKALVIVDGAPLIERVIGEMEAIFQKIILITNTPNDYTYLALPIYEDLMKELGPLGGIYTGLNGIQTNAGFFVPCDMPFLNQKLIRYMVEIRNDFEVVVPRITGKLEPLCALYSKRCLPSVKRLIDAQEYQIFRFFDDVSVRFVEKEEIQRFDPELRSFFNINSPEDLNRYEVALQRNSKDSIHIGIQ
jgi:molybdopterin-guanine dinucleotide biosynthesis protein A